LKTRIVVILLVLLTAAGAWYFLIEKRSGSGRIEKLIPATSVGVLSIGNVKTFYEKAEGYDWWDELAEIPLFSSGQALLARLDTLDIQSDLASLPVYVSLHITANNQIEPLYFIQSKGFSWNPEAIRTILNRAYGAINVSVIQRTYQDQVFREVVLPEEQFSYFIQENFLVISGTALLIEDVIRAVDQDLTFLAGIDYKLGASRANVSLLLDCGKLDDLGSVFSTEAKVNQGLDGLFLGLDVETTAQGVLFTGRSVSGVGADFNEETGLTLKNFVPTAASSLEWYGRGSQPGNTLSGLDLDRYLGLHSGELCRVKMDLNNEDEDLALFVGLENPGLAESMLSDYATSLMTDGDTLFRESFMDTDITFINKAELPKELYGEKMAGFEQTYYVVFNNVLVFGNSVEVLKTLLEEYEAENTWGRSIQRRQYMDNLVQEANLTAVYNFEYLLEGLNDKMKTNWQTFFDQRSGLTAALDVFSFQLNTTGSGVLVNASLDFNEAAGLNTGRVAVSGTETSNELETRMNAFADTTLSSAPFVVTNHNNGEREMIFQDVANGLYLVDDQGVVQWKKAINMPVNGNISQIDYYNNRKLQYFFFTDSAMHVIDRNGDDVEGFPKAMNTILPLGGHRIIDYDNTKRYRYAGADRRGNVYLYDKEGALLEGWNPKAIGSRLLAVPQHVRIRGRDCFVMVEATGEIHLTNRRGESYPGFPYSTGKRLAGDIRIVKGSDFSRSAIIVASDNGEIIQVNFEGAVRDRKQLLRPDASSRYELLQDKLNTGYVVLRRDGKIGVIIDESGKELFSFPLAASANAEFGFYNFRNDREVFVFRNLDTDEVSIYNKEGKLLTPASLKAIAPPGIIYYQSRGEYELFINFANKLTVYKVRK
jgi:hypothetical protein